MRTFKYALFAFGAVLFSFTGQALAADTQVDADTWRCLKSPSYARTDSVCFDADDQIPALVGNGSPSVFAGSATYKHTFDDGAGLGVFCEDSASYGTHGDCAGNTTLVQCTCTFSNGLKLNWFPLVTATIDPPMTATGFNLAGDQASNDGQAIYSGVSGATGRPFTIGDDSFYFCMELNVDDVSGIDASFAGFVEILDGTAWNADSEALNSYAGIGIEGTAASGLTVEDVYISTEDDGGGIAETDTTDSAADETTHKYCTYVTGGGVVTYTFDDAAPTVTAAYTFDDGIMVVPYFSFLHTADLAGAVDIVSWEVGFW